MLSAHCNEALALAKNRERAQELVIVALAQGRLRVDDNLRGLRNERGIKTGHDLSWELIDAHVIAWIVDPHRSRGGDEHVRP